MPRAEDLVRQERPLLLTEVRPPPPAPSLTPPLPEPDSAPEVQTPPPGGGASSRDIREDTAVNSRPETPPVEHNSPPVSAPPPSVTTPSPPVGTPLSLERGQRTRQPPAYLKDFICDCITSGSYEGQAGCRTERLAAKRGSVEHQKYINFCEGGVVGGINAPGANSSSHAQQTRCPVFSSADITKGRCIKSIAIQA